MELGVRRQPGGRSAVPPEARRRPVRPAGAVRRRVGGGRGDYLCIEVDGITSRWVHNEDGERINQFKYSEQKDRANIH